jgi:hypothetical protein
MITPPSKPRPFVLYVPKPHAMQHRLIEFRVLPSLWTPNKQISGKS